MGITFAALLLLARGAGPDPAAGAPLPGMRLADEQVARFAELALRGIAREYPNKPSNVMVGPESVRSPRQMHPAFYGSFDWHSSMHGHWMLVRLLKTYPGCSVGARIRAALGVNLTAANLRREADYFRRKENRSFERMYGWAWTLRLAAELRTWKDPDGRRWAEAIAPLVGEIVALVKGYLPRLSRPIRTGEHFETAFALAQIHDYAATAGDRELLDLVVRRARDYYLADRDYPVLYEPSGQDFFSTGLNEADLMRRVLPRGEFSAWLTRFFPGLERGDLGHLLEPAVVSDVTDPKIVHLAGLNLTRAWAMNGIAHALAEGDPRVAVLRRALRAHCAAGLGYVFSGHYEGEHWLASFAVYLLTEVGVR